MQNKGIVTIMSEKKRHCGTGKPVFMIMMIGVPGQSKGKALERVVEVLAEELQTFAKEDLAHLRAVRRSARKRQHMHLNGYVMMQPDHVEREKADMMFAMWHSMTISEQMKVQLNSLEKDMPELRFAQEPRVFINDNMASEIVGLKYGKGYKLRCWEKGEYMKAA